MVLYTEINGQRIKFDSENFYDISIPLLFNGDQPNSYNVEKARSKAYQEGKWIGDTRQGGSCNFETINLTPHCNGTHTECIGHITKKRFSINKLLKNFIYTSKVITVDLDEFDKNSDNYDPTPEGDELVISKNDLLEHDLHGIDALIIRTRPNDESKMSRQYADLPPAYFTNDAMEYLSKSKLKHILVDLPSVDRMYDDGKLTNHRIWWNVNFGEYQTNQNSYLERTITEFIYVDDIVNDGDYILNFQIAPFSSDASPSKPLIYPFEKVNE